MQEINVPNYILMQYKFAEKDKLWGLQDSNKNWVVEPQFESYSNSYDESINHVYPENLYVFNHQNKYYLFNEKLINLYPEGVVSFESFDRECLVSEYNCYEYAYLVKSENGLYGFTYSFENSGVRIDLPNGLVEGHLNTEWEKIFKIDYFGFQLIKDNDLYYFNLFFGENKMYQQNTFYHLMPNNFSELLKNFPEIILPSHLEQIGVRRFMIELYYCHYEWDAVCRVSKTKAKEITFYYAETGKWLMGFLKKNELQSDILAWIYLKLFYPNFNGKTVSKNIKKQLMELKFCSELNTL